MWGESFVHPRRRSLPHVRGSARIPDGPATSSRSHRVIAEDIMDQLSPPTLVARYLDLVESVLINSIYRDRAMDPGRRPSTTNDGGRRAATGLNRP